MSARRLIPLAALAVSVATLLVACTGKNAVSSDPNAFRFVSATSKGQTYPIAKRKDVGTISGTMLNGTGGYDLKSDLGKVVVINFWATWCGPCKVETPQFDNVYRAYKDKGVTFVGIDTKNSPKSFAQSFVKDNDISYPIVYDEPGRSSLSLGKLPAASLPYTVVVDKKGKVAGVYLGALAPKDIEPTLDSLLKEA